MEEGNWHLCLWSYQSHEEQLLTGTSKFYSVCRVLADLWFIQKVQWKVFQQKAYFCPDLGNMAPVLELVSSWVKSLVLRLCLQQSVVTLLFWDVLPDLSFHSYPDNIWSCSLDNIRNIGISPHCKVLGNNPVKPLLLYTM